MMRERIKGYNFTLDKVYSICILSMSDEDQGGVMDVPSYITYFSIPDFSYCQSQGLV